MCLLSHQTTYYDNFNEHTYFSVSDMSRFNSSSHEYLSPKPVTPQSEAFLKRPVIVHPGLLLLGAEEKKAASTS